MLEEYHQLLIFGLAFAAMFMTTFLRGFQNKNVAGGHKKLAFFIGAAMTAFEGLVLLLLARTGDPAIIAFTALGSGFGWVAGMKAHDAVMRKRHKALKKAKKTKRREQIEALAAEIVEDRLKSLGVV